MAYAARYGKQPMSVLNAMLWSDLQAFVSALTRLVQRENEPPEE